jgi:hypothetical protein
MSSLSKYLVAVVFLCSLSQLSAQIGFGVVTGIDLYQYYDQGELSEAESTSSGSAIANIILGPKMWIGGSNFSVSLEAPLNWGMFAFDLTEFKGLGALSFPLAAKFNFGAASGWNEDRFTGWSFGGGLQYTNTEIYGTNSDFEGLIEEGYMRTYFGEIASHFGFNGFDMALYARYGWNESSSRTVNVGLITNLNLTYFAKKRKRSKKKMEDLGEPESQEYTLKIKI